MPANVEVKARLSRRENAIAIARELSNTEGQVLEQEDTFFKVKSGRLKLRVEEGRDGGRLIHYHRPNTPGPKLSNYTIATTNTPDQLRTILTLSIGELGRVKKRRVLFEVGQTRVHIDTVQGLEDFLELEVVMRGGQLVSEGEMIADNLMKKLGVSPTDLISCAYLDLILKQ